MHPVRMVRHEHESVTAQDAYRRLLTGYIAPALRELGFRRGPSPGAFRLETPAHAAEVRFIKSRYSTRQEVDFWINLHTSDITTEWVYWDWTLHGLAHCRRWTLQAGAAIEPVADSVLRAFRSYGWPAIEAALDNPGYPPDRAIPWPRTFPKFPRGPSTPEEEAAIRRIRSEAYHTSAWTGNKTFALLEILEKDPEAEERQGAALRLIPQAGSDEIRRALQAAAALDEDVEVRWAARYALRLAGTPG